LTGYVKYSGSLTGIERLRIFEEKREAVMAIESAVLPLIT
jgi:hypothetical protein